VERNKKLTAFAPKPYFRNALMLTMTAAVFIGFGMFSQSHFLSAYFIVFGMVLLCGAVLALLNSRKIARAALSDRN
jgi:hypothetical protein